MFPAISLDDPPTPRPSRRGLPRRMLTSVTVPAAAVLLTAYVMATEFRPVAGTPSDKVAPAPAALPRLVAPASVAAGSTLVMLGYRDSDLCGPTEVRLDGTPLPVTTAEGVAATNSVFISMRIPADTPAGPHLVELFGPMRAAGGMLCGNTPEHQARIARATIAVHR